MWGTHNEQWLGLANVEIVDFLAPLKLRALYWRFTNFKCPISCGSNVANCFPPNWMEASCCCFCCCYLFKFKLHYCHGFVAFSWTRWLHTVFFFSLCQRFQPALNAQWASHLHWDVASIRRFTIFLVFFYYIQVSLARLKLGDVVCDLCGKRWQPT